MKKILTTLFLLFLFYNMSFSQEYGYYVVIENRNLSDNMEITISIEENGVETFYDSFFGVLGPQADSELSQYVEINNFPFKYTIEAEAINSSNVGGSYEFEVTEQQFGYHSNIFYIESFNHPSGSEIVGEIGVIFYPVHLENPLNANICEEDQITLRYVKDVRYKLGSGDWKPVPNPQGANMLNIVPKDSLPDWPQNGSAIGQQLHFKTGYNDQWLNGNIITYDIKPCPIPFYDYSVINPSCSSRKDGSIVLYFKRQLENNEKLILEIYDDTGSGQQIFTIPLINNLVSETINGQTYYKYEITNNTHLGDGNYYIKYHTEYNGISTNKVRVPDISSNNNMIQLINPAPLVIDTLQTTINNVTCHGGQNGSINLAVKNGGYGVDNETISYEYSLDHGSNWQSFSQASYDYTPGTVYHTTISGLHAVKDTLFVHAKSSLRPDKFNCYKTFIYEITQPPAIQASFTTTNVTCYGGSDGEVEINPSGGTGNDYWYSLSDNPYDWHSLQMNTVIDTLHAGQYDIYIKDSNDCEVSLQFEIGQNDKVLFLAHKNNDVTCFGGDDGSISISAEGGNGGYKCRYRNVNNSTWVEHNFVNDSTTTINLGAGRYIIKVSDSIDCTGYVKYSNPVTDSLTIKINQPQDLTFSLNKQDITCHGADNGQISIVASGGTGSYAYKINNSGNINDSSWVPFSASGTPNDPEIIPGLSPNTYYIFVRDRYNESNYCVANVQETSLSEPLPIGITFNNIVSPVAGQSNGSAQAIITGGTPLLNNHTLTDTSYTCVWKDENDNAVNSVQQIVNNEFVTAISNRQAGNYTLTVTDANACEKLDSIHLVALSVDLLVTQPINCNGEQGKMTANAIGGTGQYTYAWYHFENGQWVLLSQETNEVLQAYAGNYKVEVTDSSGSSTEASIILNEPSILILDGISITNVSCFGEHNGSAGLSISGGTPSYVAHWYEYDNNNQLVERTDLGNTLNVTGLDPGNYSVLVTDANDCIIDNGNNGFIDFSITEPQAPLAITITNYASASVAGGTDGYIHFEITGGTPGYTITCQDNNNNPVTVTDAGNGHYSVVNLANDTYQIEVTDLNACTDSQSLSLDFEITLTVQDPIHCNGGLGTLSAVAGGGSGTYSDYTWYKIENGQENLISQSNITTLQTSAGTYKVCVYDGNQTVCSIPFDFQEPDDISVSQIDITNVLCFGDNTGAIDITVTGGYSGQYIYQWYGPNSFSATTQDINNLPAGTYRVKISDAQYPNCMIQVDNLIVTVLNPALQISNISISNVNHIGQAEGSISFDVTGGTPPYTVTCHDSNNNPITVTDAGNGHYTIDNLAVDSYQVDITDTNACSLNQQFEITEPESIDFNYNFSPILCHGGSTTVTVTDITGGYAGQYYICNWYDDNQTLIGTGFRQDLPAGNFQIVVSDSYNNTTTQNIQITEPAEITATYTVTDILCNGDNTGAISMNVSGGTPFSVGEPYQFTWEDAQGHTGSQLTNLYAGTYSVTITDSQSCTTTVQNIIIEEQPAINIFIANPTTDFISPSLGQQDGYIKVTVSNGQPPYTYQWYHENETTNNFEIIPGATTDELSNIGEGTYKVEVYDNNNCSSDMIFNLGALQPMQVDIIQIDFISCHNGNDAVLQANAQGGAGGYHYTWYDSNGQQIGQNANEISGLSAGDYYVEVTDLRNNSVTSNVFTVSEPDQITIQPQLSHSACGNGADWTIHLDMQGGTPPYSYNWNTGATTQEITNIPPGNYLVVVTDANNCQEIQAISISSPDIIEVSEVLNQPSCYNACDGSISLSITGGLPPYLVQWDNGSTTETINDLCGGNYSVSITDGNNCTITQDYVLINPDPIPLDLGPDITTCGNNPVTFDISINDPNASYLWSSSNGFSSTSPVVQLQDEGDYTATITNSINCSVTDQIHISSIDNTYHTDFLISTQVFTGQEVLIINTSVPIATNTTWVVPNNVQIVSQTNERIRVIFPIAGFYDVGLRSNFANGCYQDYTKTVIVNDQTDLPDNGNNGEPFILDFSVIPNPSSGNFTVSVHLLDHANISLRLYSMVTNALIDEKNLNDVLDISENYQLQLPPGMYLLLLETPQGYEIRKVVIQ